MSSRARFVAGLALAGTLAAGGARADDKAAEALYQEGRHAAAAQDWVAACRAFQASQDREPAPGTLLNLADCEEHRGELVDAHAHFDAAARLFRRGDERSDYARERARALERRMVEAAAANATAPTTAPPAPPSESPSPATGSHASASPPPDTSGGRLTAPIAANGHGDWSRPATFVSFGAGALGLGFGIVGGLLTMKAQSTVNRDCQPGCRGDGLQAETTGKTASVVSTVGFAAAGVGAAAGLGFLLLAPKRPAAGALALRPLVGGATLGWSGAF